MDKQGIRRDIGPSGWEPGDLDEESELDGSGRYSEIEPDGSRRYPARSSVNNK